MKRIEQTPLDLQRWRSSTCFVEVVKYVCNLFGTSPYKRWRLIPSPWVWDRLNHSLLMNRMWQWQHVWSRACIVKDIVTFTLLSFGSLTLGESSSVTWGHSRTPMERGFLSPASTILPGMWVNHLESGPARLSQGFRWLQFLTSWQQPRKRPWARPAQLNHSWIPDPWKLETNERLFS